MIPEPELQTMGVPYQRMAFAENQEEYETLPVVVFATPERQVLSRWQPTAEERQALIDGACVDLRMWTFGGPLQPVMLGIEGVESEG